MWAREIFNIAMALGYFGWALCMAMYVWPRMRAMDRVEAQRAIAVFNSSRFFGLAFLLPGFVGPNLPQGFAAPVAYGDLASALLAILAADRARALSLLAAGLGFQSDRSRRPCLRHGAVSLNLPSVAGQLGAGFAIPMLCVPALFWTHLLAFWLLLRAQHAPARSANVPMSLAATE